MCVTAHDRTKNRWSLMMAAGELFTELAQRYAFPELNSVKVAVNDEFAGWDVTLTEGDSVVFIPPVAGG